MRIAPHLVHPLPFLIPTYGRGLRGKLALSVALKTHDLLGFDRNRSDDPAQHLPGGRMMSREECLRLVPGIDREGLTGAGSYFDCRMCSSERLVMAVLRAAITAGAEVANYVEVTGFLSEGRRIAGVRVADRLTGDQFTIQARAAINACGPWADKTLELLDPQPGRPRLPLSRAFNVLVNRHLTTEYAVGVYGQAQFASPDGTVSKETRMYFMTPWHSGSLIGTEHLAYHGGPDDASVTDLEGDEFLATINDAYPPAHLSLGDVVAVYAGLLPAAGHRTNRVTPLKHHQIVDHSRSDGLGGLISMIGVKFTEARRVAEKAVDIVLRQLGATAPGCSTHVTPVHGGDIGSFHEFLGRELASLPNGIETADIEDLAHRYGASYPEVLEHLPTQAESSGALWELSPLQRAEVVHGVRNEMAQKLSDVVFRRTTLGMVGVPREQSLNEIASIMSKELGWNLARARREVEGLQPKREAALTNRH